MLAARQVICNYYREKGAILTPEQVFLTTSSSESFSMLFKLLCNPGQAVLCPRPSYPLLAPLAGLEAIKLNQYNLIINSPGEWRYDCHPIESALTNKTRAVIVVSPNNPTGSVLGPSRRRQLQKLCADREIPLIVDEVFLDYCDMPFNTAAGESQSLTFVLSGFSKILGLPQLKLGWIVTVGPEKLLRQVSIRLEHMLDAYLSVSGPVQAAAEVWFREKSVLQQAIHKRLKCNLSIIQGIVKKVPCLELWPGNGGWSVVLAVRTGITDDVLALHLLETHNVFLHPGYLYDFPGDNCLVISLLTPPDVLRKGLTAIIDTLA
jgi:aspartate/methionine/tyrosine aminotransferase